MQPRVHQAFYTVKAKCWQLCKNERSTPEQRQERLRCVTEKCYEPSQAADKQSAHEAGVAYEQMQTPLLVRAVYGSRQPRFVVMLRDPIDRYVQCYSEIRPHVEAVCRRFWLQDGIIALPPVESYSSSVSRRVESDHKMCVAIFGADRVQRAGCILLSGRMGTTTSSMATAMKALLALLASQSQASTTALLKLVRRRSRALCIWRACHKIWKISSFTVTNFCEVCTPSGFISGCRTFQEKAFWWSKPRTTLLSHAKLCSASFATWVSNVSCPAVSGRTFWQLLRSAQLQAASTCCQRSGHS